MNKNSWWLHFKGGVYQFLGVAQDANYDWNKVYDLPTPEEQASAALKGNRALYKGHDGVIWDRPLEEFVGNHSSGVKRFLLISEEPIHYDQARLLANKMIAGIK